MSSIAVAMVSMGYLTPRQRASCSNCSEARLQVAHDIRSGLRCTKGGFYVNGAAVCRQHQAKPGYAVSQEARHG